MSQQLNLFEINEADEFDRRDGVINGFQYNEHGVCMNPELVYSYKDKRYKVELYVAENWNGWTYAYTLEHKDGGSSCGISIGEAADETRQEAIMAGLRQCRYWYGFHDAKKVKDAIMKEYEKYEPLQHHP